jgi:hypothetical protein
MRRAALGPIVATLAAAALLSGAAAYTVQRAGCEDPGRYVHTGNTVELVGGCIERGDLPVGPAPVDPDSTDQNGAHTRP